MNKRKACDGKNFGFNAEYLVAVAKQVLEVAPIVQMGYFVTPTI